MIERLASTYPDVYQNRRALVLPLWLTPWGAPALMRGILMVLSVAVSFVLLLTAANVANLLVARALDRRREMAMRLALGASRGRLIRQMLIESLLLGLLGGLGATFVASWSARLLSVLSPPAGFSIRFNVHLDITVLVFVICVAVVTGILSGVAFAIHGSRADAAVVLREEAHSLAGGGSGTRLRRALVAAEVAIATVVLIAATMSLRSIQRAERINPGFNRGWRVPGGIRPALGELFDGARAAVPHAHAGAAAKRAGRAGRDASRAPCRSASTASPIRR